MKTSFKNSINPFYFVIATLMVGLAVPFPTDVNEPGQLNHSPGTACAAVIQGKEQSAENRGAATRTATGKTSPGAMANVLVTTDEDYKIGCSDVIEVEIEDAPELSGTFRVNSKGTFLMHYLGRIAAKDKTTEELARQIYDGLNQRYIVDPRVTVTVKQYNSRSFFIQGSVQSAGVYQIEGRPTLLELITLAGGLQANHGSTAFVIRKLKPEDGDDPENPAVRTQSAVAKPEDKNQPASPVVTADAGTRRESALKTETDEAEPKYTLQKVNINGLLKGRFDQNMFLEPGDIVNIPQTEVFFVAGDVKSPGSFGLKEGTTLRQALSLAQGLNFTAAGRGAIFRENLETGKRQEIAVDFGNVMKGRDEDLVIFPNDIIVVPNSKFKKATAPILSAFAVNSVLLPMRF